MSHISFCVISPKKHRVLQILLLGGILLLICNTDILQLHHSIVPLVNDIASSAISTPHTSANLIR